MPVGTGYPPHIVVLGTNDYLAVRVIDVPENMKQGQEFLATLQLMYPEDVDYSALKKDAEFEILEGSRVVGTGIVEVTEHESKT